MARVELPGRWLRAAAFVLMGVLVATAAGAQHGGPTAEPARPAEEVPPPAPPLLRRVSFDDLPG